MKKIKMIVSDIDGTLLNRHGKVLPSTTQALQQARDLGIIIGLASARSEYSLHEVLNQGKMKKLIDFVICYNGLLIYDYKDGNIIRERPLNTKQINTLLAKVWDFNCNIIFSDGNFLYVKQKNKDIIKLAQQKAVTIKTITKDSKEDYSTYKLSLLSEQPFSFSDIQQLQLLNSVDYIGQLSSDIQYEFVALGLTKAAAIAFVASKYGITMENVLAFGDHNNDIEMLKQCGIGVCLANGSPAAKEAADYITASNDKSGIALFLNKLFIDDLD